MTFSGQSPSMQNEFMQNKQILITGGSGSFGRAFLRFVLANARPKRLVVFSRDEYKQSQIRQEFPQTELRFFLGDVRDYDRLKRAFRNIDCVIHAAALKQVPAAEYNPIECILTNVIGAENVIKAALDCNVERVLALSTDKAVNPINLYGASKLCADKLFVAANNLAGERGTRFSVVRYGNVLGSRGSVVPLFREQVKKGVLTITDERMTRFWISLEQSVRFVAQSLARLRGGEIFVPKIPSMKIIDLAKVIAKTSTPQARIDIVGIRAGEKIHEVLVPQEEARDTFEGNNCYIIVSRTLSPSFGQSFAQPVHALQENLLPQEEYRRVAEDFEYASDQNKEWLDEQQLKQLLDTETP